MYVVMFYDVYSSQALQPKTIQKREVSQNSTKKKKIAYTEIDIPRI